MKFTHPVTSAPKYANLAPVEDDDLPASPPLSKAQTVRLCDRLHQAVITAYGLPDIDIDYRGLIEESIREKWTPDAIKRGRRRGSAKHGQIPCLRQKMGGNCRIWFHEVEVIEWFEANIEPILLLKSTHKTH